VGEYFFWYRLTRVVPDKGPKTVVVVVVVVFIKLLLFVLLQDLCSSSPSSCFVLAMFLTSCKLRQALQHLPVTYRYGFLNKKHLKNVGLIRHCEPPHCHSPGVATVARRLRIDVHNNNDNA